MSLISTFPKSYEPYTDDLDNFHLGRRSLRIMKKYSDKTQLLDVSNHSSETHGSMRIKSIRLAQALLSAGIGLNDVVLTCAANSADVIATYIGCLFIGAPTAAIPQNLKEIELEYYLKVLEPKMVFCDPSQADSFRVASEKLQQKFDVVIFGNEPSKDFLPFEQFQLPTGTEEFFSATDFDASSTAIIVFSSGSTGMPKGICLSHRLLSNVITLPVRHIDPDLLSQDIMLNFSSMSWISGAMTMVLVAAIGQTWLFSSTPFSTDLALKSIRRYWPTCLTIGTVNAVEFVEHQQSGESFIADSLRCVLVIGGNLEKKLKDKIQEICPNSVVKNTYGSTEVAGPIAAVDQAVPGSVGKILPWFEWKLVDLETNEEITQPNCVGELWVKGPTLFQTYYNNEVATKEAFTEDGFYKTGDLFYHNDNNYFFFVDRHKQIFKCKRQQVSPIEIETVIHTLDGVKGVCVVGLPMRGVGEVAMAFVKKSPESTITAQQIKDHVESELSDWKHLTGGVVFLEQMPKTHNGKIDRKYLESIKFTAKAE